MKLHLLICIPAIILNVIYLARLQLNLFNVLIATERIDLRSAHANS